MTEQTRPAWKAFDATAFAGRIVAVTGAGSGIGRETAGAFAALGARVALLDRDGDAASRAADELPGAIAIPVDVADPQSVDAGFGRIDEALGEVDHLAHCAAIITSTPTLEADAAHWRRVLDVNLVGTFNVVQAALRRMTARGRGSVVLVASDAGTRGGGGLIADAAYAASKAGVLNFVKSLARETAGSGVRVNAVAPGPTDTPLHSGVSDDLKRRIAEGIPLRRMGRPDDIAAAIVYLSSDAAAFAHGAAFDVDGGTSLR